MQQYYAKRATEYENIYQKPERQSSLAEIKQFLKEFFNKRTVYEVACGTGYWTQFISESARHILSADINHEVIEIACSKYYHCPTDFIIADAMQIQNGLTDRDAGFAGFWISHVVTEQLADFITALHANLISGAKVCFVDNIYVEGESTPISRTDTNGNTYQMRTVSTGEHYEVVKNFPSEQELITLLAPYAKNVEYRKNKYFWIVSYETK